MKIRRRDRNKGIIIFFALFCFILTGGLFSDDFKKVRENIIKNAWKKVGFIYVAPSILLKDVGYNTNIFYDDEEKTPDWTADLGFRISFSALIGKRFILVVRESPYYSFYSRNKDLQYFNNELLTSFYSWIGPFNLNYIYSEGNFLSRPTLEFGSRIITKKNNNFLSIDFGNYKEFFVRISAKTENYKFQSTKYYENFDIANLLNNERRSVGFSFHKVIFTRTFLFLSSEFYDLNFKADVYRSGSGRIVSVGIEFPKESILSGELRMGIKDFSPDTPVTKKYLKLTGSGDFSLRLTRKFKIMFKYIIDNDYSYYAYDQYFDFRSYTISFDYYMIGNIKAGFSLYNSESNYRKITGEKTGRNDRINQMSLKLGSRIFEDMEIGIQYSRYKGRSSFVEYKRNYLFIGGYVNHEF